MRPYHNILEENDVMKFIDLEKQLSKEDFALLKNKESNDELQKLNLQLVRKAKKGDIEERNRLFLINVPNIISTLTKNFNIDTRNMLDFLSESFLYFCEAVEDYEEKKNNKFSLFLQVKIRTRWLNVFGNVKASNKRNATYSIDNEELWEDCFDKYLAVEDEAFDQIDLHLSEEEKEIKKSIYYDKENMVRVSNRLGVSYQKVRKIKNGIIDKERT